MADPVLLTRCTQLAALDDLQTREKEKEAAPKQNKSKQVETISQTAADLQEVFSGFTAGAAEMDEKTFAKVAKDTKIIDKNFTATDQMNKRVGDLTLKSGASMIPKNANDVTMITQKSRLRRNDEKET